MAEANKKKDMYYVHVAISFGLLALMWVLPNPEPITPLGMKLLGVFLMMIYAWSTIETLWPSIVGLVLMGAIGLSDAGSNDVWLQAVGSNTVLLVLFAMILFGAIDQVGDTKYIAKFILTRKVLTGRPYAYMALFFLACAVISGLLNVFIALILMWPIATRNMEIMGVTKEDRVWKFFFVGMFLAITLFQPLLPFKGAPLVPLSAFTKTVGTAIPYLPYIVADILMSTFILVCYLLAMKFILRIDVSKMKSVTPEMVEEQMPLPKMNLVQKIYLWMIPVYLVCALVPNFVKGNPVCDMLNYIGILGVTAAFVGVCLIIHVDGKPILNFKEVAYKHFNWGIFFMIAAAVYAAGMLSKPTIGVSQWLIQMLNPLLGGQPEWAFVCIMLLVSLIITNFANNAAMAVVLLPIVVGFSEQLGIDPAPVFMGVVLMVFVAMLTPSASPHAAMMHGNKELYTQKDIMSIGIPVCVFTWLAYSFIGYPLIKVLLNVLG